MVSICVIGSLNYDLVTGVDVVPAGGETVHAEAFATHYGGKGANQAYALRRLTPKSAADVIMVGCVGNDTFGTELREHLRNSGVDISQVQRLESERTGTATILVESSGENRIMVYPGANGRVSKDDAIELLDREHPRFVVLQNEIPWETTLAALDFAANDPKMLSVFNPSPLPKTSIAEWPRTGLLCVNESEASALSNITVNSQESAERAVGELLKYCEICVITLGGSGVVWQAQDGLYESAVPGFAPAKKVEKVVDTTGAGDTFLAALVSRLAAKPHESFASHISFAQSAAAIAVSRPGAASSIPSLEEVQE